MNTKPTTSSSQSEANNSGKLPCKNPLNFLADVGVMQQPTTEARNQSQPAAFLAGSAVDASLSHFHPGPYSDTQSQVQSNSEPATEDAGPSVVKCSQARVTHMSTRLVFNQPKRAVLTPQGVYAALVTKVTVNSKEGTNDPETVEVQFTLNELNQQVTRTYPAKMKGRSPLFRDAKSILRRGPTADELEQGFEPGILKDRSCRVSIAHRLDHNGHPQSQTITVMAAETTPAATAQPVAAQPVAA